MSLRVSIRRLPHAADLPLPRYQTPGAAGMDLAAAVSTPLELAPGDRRLVPTGLQLAIPSGYEAQVRPRSGLAAKYGVTVLNSPGTIDSDYRGAVKVILVSRGREPFSLRRGDRIAQMVFSPVTGINWEELATLPPTGRGPGGFGHTG